MVARIPVLWWSAIALIIVGMLFLWWQSNRSAPPQQPQQQVGGDPLVAPLCASPTPAQKARCECSAEAATTGSPEAGLVTCSAGRPACRAGLVTSSECLPRGDRWSYDGCLLIPQDQIGGVTEIIFTTPRDPTQCRRLCQQSPTARFFSYWHETGSCHLHERLPGGEAAPEAMTQYLYAVPQQHWLSGFVPKDRRPPNFTDPLDCPSPPPPRRRNDY